MLDVSTDKVPTMDTLRAMIARLASWKINQVQLYTEHTFAYRDHPDVHRAASPFTAEEILELDAFCADRHVELVPNQNALGHMNRWLAHERYRPLAIAPDGFVDPFGITRPPMTIDPTNPQSMALVRGLLANSCHSSRAAGSTWVSTRPGNFPVSGWPTSPAWVSDAARPARAGRAGDAHVG